MNVRSAKTMNGIEFFERKDAKPLRTQRAFIFITQEILYALGGFASMR